MRANDNEAIMPRAEAKALYALRETAFYEAQQILDWLRSLPQPRPKAVEIAITRAQRILAASQTV